MYRKPNGQLSSPVTQKELQSDRLDNSQDVHVCVRVRACENNYSVHKQFMVTTAAL